MCKQQNRAGVNVVFKGNSLVKLPTIITTTVHITMIAVWNSCNFVNVIIARKLYCTEQSDVRITHSCLVRIVILLHWQSELNYTLIYSVLVNSMGNH